MAQERLHHILEAQRFSREWLEQEFFPEVDYIKQLFKLGAKSYSDFLNNKSVCLLFYQPSTRTRISFGQAAGLMGAHVESTENAKDFSSAIKGESLIDTIRVVNALHFDAVVLRSDYTGGAKDAADVSQIPVINAGDGTGQHPTQALLDVYTIFDHFKRLNNLNIGLVGDLKNGRTTRSLAYLLSKSEGIHFELIAAKGLEMKNDILEYFKQDHIKKRNITLHKAKNLESVADKLDVVYLTRAQKSDINGIKIVDCESVSVNKKIMGLFGSDVIIMHPLPRSNDFNELPEEFTQDQKVKIFKQVENGLFTRMALLKMLIG